MSKHKHHKHHTHKDSVDWKKKRMYFNGRKYTFSPYTDALTPCTWHKKGSDGDYRALNVQYELDELDEQLLRIYVLEQEEKHQKSSSQSSESASSASETPKKPAGNPSWKKHVQGPPAKGKRIERTKYGVRVWTIDGKTYWDFCVNDSTKHSAAAAVRVTLPPPRRDGKQFHMGIFDLETMEAIRRELARGPKPRK
jgi:hypothetical protein